MLKSLVKIANRLDSLGLTKEADLIDSIIIKSAQMEDISPSERVARAIENSKGMPHFENAFITRNPSPDSEGSTFLTPQDADSLASAEWEPYNHPDVKSPAVAFKADIPGYFGLVSLESLNEDMPVKIVKSHKGAIEDAACIISSSEVERPVEDFTTILLGPGKDGSEIVWTFFPGPPIAPKSTPWTPALESEVKTVENAISAGFEWGKLGGS